jgi:hypothetical protein
MVHSVLKHGETFSMRIGKLPLLAAGLLVAGALALGATMAVAQSKTDDPQKGAQNGGQNGATAELPHSRTPDKDLPPLSLLPRSGDELEGSEEAPGGHTCPDRGNTLELII